MFIIAMQFEPSEEAVQAISMLLNATTPFFLEDDPLDVEDEPLTTTLPPTTNPPRTGLTYIIIHNIVTVREQVIQSSIVRYYYYAF